jgi:hypothetical protein
MPFWGETRQQKGRSMSIHEKIQRYYSGMADEHHRYRSWEHCYQYFHGLTAESVAVNRDTAALHLGFYLASWGMYRPSGFLFQCGYTVHYGVINKIFQPQFSSLWTRDFGTADNDADLIPIILDAVQVIREAYKQVAGSREATDTLVTKVILGTFGSLPARDRLFNSGFEEARSGLNTKFFTQLLKFTREHRSELLTEQRTIERVGGIKYPLMKLVDMYFWQIGAEISAQKQNADPELAGYSSR